jgi:hypothetical protein
MRLFAARDVVNSGKRKKVVYSFRYHDSNLRPDPSKQKSALQSRGERHGHLCGIKLERCFEGTTIGTCRDVVGQFSPGNRNV